MLAGTNHASSPPSSDQSWATATDAAAAAVATVFFGLSLSLSLSPFCLLSPHHSGLFPSRAIISRWPDWLAVVARIVAWLLEWRNTSRMDLGRDHKANARPRVDHSARWVSDARPKCCPAVRGPPTTSIYLAVRPNASPPRCSTRSL